jgi:ribonuclease Z
MDVVTLGTGNPLPDPNRAGPSSLVRSSAGIFLVDCGRAVLMRAAAIGVLPVMLRGVLLTHLHSDHITDLNDVITSRWVMTQQPNPLVVYGPEGTQEVVDAILAMLRQDIGYRLTHHEDLTWEPPVEVHELAADAAHTVLAEGDVTITAQPTDHKPVHPSLGYRIDDGDASVVLAGDTLPCPGLDELCRGASVYVQTVCRPDLVMLVPSARFHDIIDYHSTVEQAAQTAARGGVGTFVITHANPAAMPGTEHEWIAQAAQHYDGNIVFAEDLTTLPC